MSKTQGTTSEIVDDGRNLYPEFHDAQREHRVREWNEATADVRASRFRAFKELRQGERPGHDHRIRFTIRMPLAGDVQHRGRYRDSAREAGWPFVLYLDDDSRLCRWSQAIVAWEPDDD